MTPKEFISRQTKDISEKGILKFPEDFLFPCETEDIILPNDTLVMGNEFFGSYEVLTVKGESFCHTNTITKAKFLVYAGRRRGREISIPVSPEDIETIVKNYEKYLDTILRKIERDYRSTFDDDKDVNNIVSEVFRLLNLNRL